MAQFAVFSFSATHTICGLCLAEAMILKSLYAVKFSVICMFDDYFMATFLGRVNVLLFVFGGLIRFYLGDLDANFHVGFLSGLSPNEPTEVTANVFTM